MNTNLPISQLDPVGAQVWTGVGELHTAYLGPLPSLQAVDPYQKRNMAILDLPEAYKNQSYNPYVGNMVDDAAFSMNQGYIQERILPLFQTEDLNFQWEKIENNAHLMEITPYQTQAHKVTMRRTVRRAQLVRFGIEAEFENDFLATAMGRIRWLATIGQFARSYAETMRAEGIRALCTGHRYQQEFVRQAGMPEHQELDYYLKQDLERFGIVQKTKNGLEKLNMLINKEMRMYGGQANCFIIPEELSIFSDIVRREKTDYDIAGPRGPERVNNTGARNTGANPNSALDTIEPTRWVQDVPVYTVQNMRAENVSARDSEYLRRDRQIGEFVTLLDEHANYDEYLSEHRSILMYDMDIDDMRKITLEDCVEACQRFDPFSGNVRGIPYNENDSSIRRQDKDEDFLTVLQGERRFPARYLFDIAPEYLSARCALNGGRSLAAQLVRQYGQAGRDALNLQIDRNEQRVILPLENQSAESLRLLNILGDFLIQTLGSDSLFVQNYRADRSPANLFFDWFVVQDLVPLVRETAGGRPDEPLIASRVDQAFFSALLANVPQSKKAELKAISEQVEGTTLQKGEAIRARIHQYLEEKVPGLKFQEPAHIEEWYEKRAAAYREQIAKQAPVEGEIAGYTEPGRDLTGTGYRYLYSASAHRRRAQGIQRFMPFAVEADAVESGVGRTEGVAARMVETSGALGLAGIGQFDRDPGMAARERSVDSLQYSATFEKHEAGITNSGGTQMTKVLAFAYLMTRITKTNMLALVRNNIALPMGFLLCSPHQQFATRGVIKCMQDGGTGITAVGHSSVATASQVGSRVTRLNYRTHFRAIILYPENLYVQPDVYVQEYQGGGGCRFHTPETYKGMDPEEHLQNSLICIALPCTEKNIPSPMHMTGRFATPYNVALSARSQFERLHYSTAAFYTALYDFLGMARNNGGSESTVLMPGVHHHNLVCYQGHQQNYNPKSGEYNKIIVCKGHKTKNVYAGCRKIWDGALEELEVQDYATRNAQ